MFNNTGDGFELMLFNCLRTYREAGAQILFDVGTHGSDDRSHDTI